MMDHDTLPERSAKSQMQFVKRRLLSGGAWAIGGKVLVAFLGLATNALLARLLSPEELGVYFLAYSVVLICTRLGALGLTQTVVRLVAESVGMNQYNRARRAIRLALSFSTFGAATVGLAYLIFGGALTSHLFDSPAFAAVAGVTAGWIVVAVLQGVLADTFRGFHDTRMTITLGGIGNGGNGIITGGLLSLLLLLTWMFRVEASTATVMILATGSGAASALLAGWLLRRRLASLPESGSWDELRAGEVMRVAWPLMVTNLTLFALGQSTLWIAGIFLSQEEVALYGSAYRLMLYVAMPLSIVNMVAAPTIAEMYAQSRIGELQHVLRAVATAAAVPSFLLLGTFILFGGPIMGLIFGDYYREAAVLLVPLSLGEMVSVWAGSCGQALMMTGHQVTMMTITIINGLLMVAGATWVVQSYGLIGLAIATTVGLVLHNIIMLLMVKKKVGVWTHSGFSGLLWMARSGQ